MRHQCVPARPAPSLLKWMQSDSNAHESSRERMSVALAEGRTVLSSRHRGEYQIGDVHARSCTFSGTSLLIFTPKRA